MKVIIRIHFIISLVIILSCSFAFAQSKVVTCQGKYAMGDLDTKKNARTLALMDAKRLALEQVGTYLESSSEVKNFELTKDEMNSLASGIVSVEVLEEQWKMSGENLTVTVLIRATVDTSHLGDRIASLKENGESIEEFKDIQRQLAALQEEMRKMKKGRADDHGDSPDRGKSTDKDSEHEYAALTDRMNVLDQLRSANAAMASERFTDAIGLYSNVIAISPETVEAYRGKAIACARTGKIKEALTIINKAIEIEPDDARSHGAKSFIMGKMGDFVPALAFANKAIDMAPQNAKLYRNRAKIYMMMRNRQQAVRDFKQACTLGDHDSCRMAQDIGSKTKNMQ